MTNPAGDENTPTIESIREHYGELTESLAGPAIVPGNLDHFDRALAAHDSQVAATATIAGLQDPTMRDDVEHALGQVMLAHRYDYQNKGSKPEDPGWHQCTCPWEGYWFDYIPHVAHEQFIALARMLGSGPRS